MPACPTEQVLRDLLVDRLQGDEATSIEAHLETCATCQQVMERVTALPLPFAPSSTAEGVRKADATFLSGLERRPTHDRAGARPPDSSDTASDATPNPGNEIPEVAGYDILEVLGRGGMGVVFKAWQQDLKRLVALKMVFAGRFAATENLGRFQIEAEASARLQHPNIVQIYEVCSHSGTPYLSLEFVDGGSLAQQLEGKPLPARSATRLVETLARAAHYAHQRGIIHRDLKPSNILLATDAAEPLISGTATLDRTVPKITDFGLAKLTVGGGSDQTHSGSVLGTPSYMAPEQAGGKTKEISTAVDIYALGAILYELLTGRPPFQAETPLDTVLMVVEREVVAPSVLQPRVPRDLETICLKCLQKEPQRRYATAHDLAEDLRRFLAGEPIHGRRTGRTERVIKWVKRRPAPAALCGLTAIFVIATIAGWFWWQQRRAAITASVSESFGQAKLLHEQALTSGNDLRRWSDALAAMEKTQALAATDGCDRALRQRVGEALADVSTQEQQVRLDANRDKEHQGMLVRLREIYAHLAEVDSEDQDLIPRARRVAREYGDAFRTWQIDVDGTSVQDAAARFQSYPPALTSALAGALDQWVQAEWLCFSMGFMRNVGTLFRPGGSSTPSFPGMPTGSGSWQHRLSVAQRADPDPVRNRLRDAMMRLNLSEFKTVATTADPASLPADTLQIMALVLTSIGERPLVLNLLRKAVIAHPDDYWIQFLLAESCRAAVPPLWAEAADHYMASVALQPKNLTASSNLAVCLAQVGRRDEALAICKWVLSKDPARAAAHQILAIFLRDMGDFEGAVTHGRKALEQSPDSAPIRRHLARALEMKGDSAGAFAEYQRAAEAGPTDAESQKWFGMALLGQGHTADAVRHFRRATELVAGKSTYWVDLGKALLVDGNKDEAIAAFRTAAQKVPRSPEAVPLLYKALCDQSEELHRHDRPGNALALCQQAIEAAPESERAYSLKGHIRLHQGDAPGALAAFQEAGRRRPSSEVCHAIGEIYARKGNVRDALDYLADPAESWTTQTALSYLGLLSLDGKTADFQTGCAALLERFRRTRDADDAFRVARCLVQAPDTKTDVREAVRLAQQAVSARKLVWVLNVLALAHYRAGELERAVEVGKQAQLVDPGWHPPLNWLVLALAHARLKDVGEANRLWELIEKTGPPANMNAQDKVYYELLRREVQAAVSSKNG